MARTERMRTMATLIPLAGTASHDPDQMQWKLEDGDFRYAQRQKMASVVLQAGQPGRVSWKILFVQNCHFTVFFFLFSLLFLFSVFNSSFGFSKQSLFNIVQTFFGEDRVIIQKSMEINLLSAKSRYDR